MRGYIVLGQRVKWIMAVTAPVEHNRSFWDGLTSTGPLWSYLLVSSCILLPSCQAGWNRLSSSPVVPLRCLLWLVMISAQCWRKNGAETVTASAQRCSTPPSRNNKSRVQTNKSTSCSTPPFTHNNHPKEPKRLYKRRINIKFSTCIGRYTIVTRDWARDVFTRKSLHRRRPPPCPSGSNDKVRRMLFDRTGRRMQTCASSIWEPSFSTQVSSAVGVGAKFYPKFYQMRGWIRKIASVLRCDQSSTVVKCS